MRDTLKIACLHGKRVSVSAMSSFCEKNLLILFFSDSIGIYPSIPPSSQKRIMFLSLILSFFSYKYQRTNKIQNERYFHHRYLSFFFQPNHIKSTYLSPHFNLSLILFQLISHDFSDSIPLPYLHPAVLYR